MQGQASSKVLFKPRNSLFLLGQMRIIKSGFRDTGKNSHLTERDLLMELLVDEQQKLFSHYSFVFEQGLFIQLV